MRRRSPAGGGSRRTAAGLLAASLLGAAAVSAAAPPAHAGEEAPAGYRYWSFWQQESDDGRWRYATQGPGTLRPADGSVLGFRFAVQTNAADAHRPRGETRFEEICGGTEPDDGSKRIAWVIDFGTPEDAPAGERPPGGRTECSVVPVDATAAEALAASAGPLRYNTDALLCAIADYPARGCGEQVTGAGSDDDGTDDTGAAPDPGGGPVAVIAGVTVVVVLAGAAWWRSRRRDL
ncbi:SCO2322 family protein [Streptomyces sodiiphilus]|uniref:SCO2322 family protein n=1 Tax=Streptomyces sodiiphilus TaxID=226217 RepID=A0ABN2NTZ2_9ACTN